MATAGVKRGIAHPALSIWHTNPTVTKLGLDIQSSCDLKIHRQFLGLARNLKPRWRRPFDKRLVGCKTHRDAVAARSVGARETACKVYSVAYVIDAGRGFCSG